MGRKLLKMFQETSVDGGHIMFNFYWTLECSPSCQNAWCEKLLYPGGQTPFPHCIQTDSGDGYDSDRRGSKDNISHRWKQKDSIPLNFMEAHNGDHIVCPFECDDCIFRKLRRSKSNQNCPKEKEYL